ncbi:MAG: FdhF/YdeP family oxidoreductase [Candidatus Hydrogenedentes bacterium]|nr:FdhF/YdeP family oxidoreductase [Candidatus Hydrogenedentota bacterium]
MSDSCSARKMPKSAGGWASLLYTLRKAKQVGGVWRLFNALRTKNACKTCALGMGGQLGGMVNEAGHFPEVCKKSIQAMAADMQGRIPKEFFTTFDLRTLQSFTPREMEAAGRIVEPLIVAKDDTHYKPLSWDNALGKIADKLRASDPDETFFYFSGRSSNEAGFLLNLFARVYGTNNVNNCSYYCHQASGVGLSTIYGSGTASIVLEDVEHCDTLFLVGANPASNHPRLMSTIMRMKRRGGKVIVINPIRELGLVNFSIPSSVRSMLFGTRIADLYVQPHIGGDIAFLIGVAKAIHERGAIDREFIENATVGWPDFENYLATVTWDEIIQQSGVNRTTIDRVADAYAASKGTVFAWAMGVTHHKHGVENVQAIGNLALMRGMLGRKNAGLLPIRGHSNVQGIGSMGVTPKLKAEVFKKLEERFNVSLPTKPGQDTMGSMVDASQGKVRIAFCIGGNLYGSNPDANFAADAMSKIDLVVYMNTTLNTGHAMGLGKETIILPVLARDEEKQSTTQESMFNYVRLSDGGPARHEGPRSEVEVVAGIAKRVFGDSSPVDWRKMEEHNAIREVIAAIIPGYSEIESIDKTKHEFQLGGRTFHAPKFSTPSGKAQFHTFPIPPLTGDGNGSFRLMTLRSEGQFNTVVYEDHDYYRGQERRDVILLNKSDIEKLGLKENDTVTVRSSCGALSNVIARAFDIRAGNAAMYYPEANVVVPRDVDPKSKTPAFKSVEIHIEREASVF